MSQTKQIRDYMLNGKSITQKEAYELFGCFRLPSRIWDIKKEFGDDVRDELIEVSNGKHVKRYWIEQGKQLKLF